MTTNVSKCYDRSSHLSPGFYHTKVLIPGIYVALLYGNWDAMTWIHRGWSLSHDFPIHVMYRGPIFWGGFCQGHGIIPASLQVGAKVLELSRQLDAHCSVHHSKECQEDLKALGFERVSYEPGLKPDLVAYP